MAKPEWGTKRFCQNCGARFYDMCRDPVTCPKCGTPFAPRPLVRQRKAVAAVSEGASPATAKKGKAAGVKVEVLDEPLPADLEDEELDETDEEIDSLTDDEEDDTLMEDASELGEDDDDMSEVMDHVSDPDRGDRS